MLMLRAAFRSVGGAANPFRHHGVGRPFSPRMILLVTLSLLPSLVFGFFNLGGGGGCGCPQPACPPPPPPPVCAPPPQPICPPPSPCAAAHGTRTQNASPITIPDELELRAAAFGVPVVHQSQQAPSNIEQLEKLVERYEPIETPTNADTILAEPVSNHEADADLVRAGLRGNSEIRRAPTVVIMHQEDPEPTTTIASATTSKPVESNKVKEEEGPQSKCNSQVLHKLMLDNMNDNSSESKRKINLAAEEKFGGNVDVICSRGHFSYVFSSNLYCEATKGLTTCIAFRQAV